MPLTKPQKRALWAAFEKNGAIYGKHGSNAGGAYRRMCERLAEQRLVNDSPPFPITLKGMHALLEAYTQGNTERYGPSMADLDKAERIMNALRANHP